MAIKELQTRIALKYDSYSAWTTAPGKDLVLLKGELGICYIGDTNPESNVVPTVLFKVGDGTKTFENLPWASAKAADVYSWAKASDVVYNQTAKTITFVKGNADGSDKVITFNYVTLAEVEAITNALSNRITAIENSIGEGGNIAGQVADLDRRLDAIEGDGTAENPGTIAAGDAATLAAAQSTAMTYATTYANLAETAAKTYTDEREAAIKTAYEAYADQAELDAVATANAYTDGKVTAQATKDSAQDELIAANTQAIAAEVGARATAITNVTNTITSAYEAADQAIEAKIGTVADNTTVVDMIGAAQTAAESTAANDATTKVNALRDTVKETTDALATAISDETDAREAADEALDARLDKIEAFFAGAAEDETVEGELINALDTLKEIQEFATGEGTAAREMLDAIAANATAIENLEGRVDTAEDDIDALEGRAEAVEGRAATLEDIVNGYTGAGAIKTAVEAAAALAQTGVDNAATAQAAAEAAQSAAEAAQAHSEGVASDLADYESANDEAVAAINAKFDGMTSNTVFNQIVSQLAGHTTLISGMFADADAALKTELEGKINTKAEQSDLVALDTRVSAAESKITALETASATHATKAEVEAVDAKFAGYNTTAAQKDIDDAQDARIKAIEDDYLKASDFIGDCYIFNCGTSTTVNHVVDAQ